MRKRLRNGQRDYYIERELNKELLLLLLKY